MKISSIARSSSNDSLSHLTYKTNILSKFSTKHFQSHIAVSSGLLNNSPWHVPTAHNIGHRMHSVARVHHLVTGETPIILTVPEKLAAERWHKLLLYVTSSLPSLLLEMCLLNHHVHRDATKNKNSQAYASKPKVDIQIHSGGLSKLNRTSTRLTPCKWVRLRWLVWIQGPCNHPPTRFYAVCIIPASRLILAPRHCTKKARGSWFILKLNSAHDKGEECDNVHPHQYARYIFVGVLVQTRFLCCALQSSSSCRWKHLIFFWRLKKVFLKGTR